MFGVEDDGRDAPGFMTGDGHAHLVARDESGWRTIAALPASESLSTTRRPKPVRDWSPARAALLDARPATLPYHG